MRYELYEFKKTKVNSCCVARVQNGSTDNGLHTIATVGFHYSYNLVPIMLYLPLLLSLSLGP